jgi:hypothetical protein
LTLEIVNGRAFFGHVTGTSFDSRVNVRFRDFHLEFPLLTPVLV